MFIIDATSTAPPYEQLRAQVIAAVKSGELAPGAKLPTVRRLAEDLGLAANTVARAYRVLERDEVIDTRGRHGSFIAATGDPTRRHAQQAATAYVERVVQLGLSPAEALLLVEAALRSDGAVGAAGIDGAAGKD